MKKLFLCVICLFSIVFLNFTINAEETIQNYEFSDIKQEVVYLENGNYLVKKVKEKNNEMMTRATSYYKTGELEVEEYNANDKLLWTYTLTGTFLIETGVSCVSTNATYATEIYKNTWSFSDGSTSYAGNHVTGLGVFKCKVLFITTQTINIDVTLYCDSYGNLS